MKIGRLRHKIIIEKPTETTNDLGEVIQDWAEFATWQASHTYSLGDVVEPTTPDGNVYECTTAGISGATEPSWDTDEGDTTPDNTVTWTCKIKVTGIWAEIMPLRGREYWASKQTTSKITGKIRIRYLDGITPKMRVKFGERIFNIEAVLNPNEKNIETILLVSEQK